MWGQVYAALDATWRILIIGLVLGAGLPALFAVGVNALAWGTGGEHEMHEEGVLPKPHLLGRIVAYLMFTIVVLGVLGGIGYIVAHGLGVSITFDGIIPVIKPKH